MATRAGGETAAGRGDSGSPTLRGLGAPEARLAGLVAAGLSDAEIAGRLELPVGAVQPALEALFGKLHLRSRTELALLAAGRPVDDDRWTQHGR